MTVRGGGVPLTPHGSTAGKKNGSAASELAADAYPCIMVWVFDPPHTRMWHDASCTNPQLPSNAVIPDSLKCAVVLEALKDEPLRVALRAILDRFCARRPLLHRGSGRGNGLSRSNKETEVQENG